MAKLWSGRTSGDTDSITENLNASVLFDNRLYAEDIEGSIAHAEMLSRQGIINREDADAISRGLISIKNDIESGAFEWKIEDEDVHMAIEAELTRRIGDAGKRLHTGRSRNDQVAVDFRLYVKKQLGRLPPLLRGLITALTDTAEKHINTVMPGYTHLQRAQPTTMGHYLTAYGFMFARDITRILDCMERMDFSPLGSGALTASTYPIDREYTAEKLGFNGIIQNSLDGVSDRDYALEALSDIAIIFTHLSRLSEELILWCSWEFKFIELSDRYSTGSSIMPQKKNPDLAELIRGKTGRVYGDLISLLTVMKGLPLAYNKDMQEDKERVFDALDTALICLPAMTAMIETMTVLPENTRRAASEGFINATDCADYLSRRGIPFRDAYKIVGNLTKYCAENGKTLESLTLDEYKSASPAFEADVFDAINLDNCIAARNVKGGPAPSEVLRQIAILRGEINE